MTPHRINSIRMIRIEFQVSLPSSLIVFPVAQVFIVVNNTWPAREEAFMW